MGAAQCEHQIVEQSAGAEPEVAGMSTTRKDLVREVEVSRGVFDRPHSAGDLEADRLAIGACLCDDVEQRRGSLWGGGGVELSGRGLQEIRAVDDSKPRCGLDRRGLP